MTGSVLLVPEPFIVGIPLRVEPKPKPDPSFGASRNRNRNPPKKRIFCWNRNPNDHIGFLAGTGTGIRPKILHGTLGWNRNPELPIFDRKGTGTHQKRWHRQNTDGSQKIRFRRLRGAVIARQASHNCWERASFGDKYVPPLMRKGYSAKKTGFYKSKSTDLPATAL